MFVPPANVFLFLIPSNPSNHHLILCSVLCALVS